MKFTLQQILLCAMVAIANNCFLSARGDNTSTNPAFEVAQELQLAKYDNALDSIDYEKPYREIEWPWKSDKERMEKRLQACKLLLLKGIPDSHLLQSVVNGEYSEMIEYVNFRPILDDTDQERYIFSPDEVDDLLFSETFPYIPEIQSLVLNCTKSVTDEGIKSLFYLPLLKRVAISTPDHTITPIHVTSKGIELVCRHPSIRHLSLRGMEISPEVFSTIVNNGEQIEYLGISANLFADNDLSTVAKMKSLTSIALSNSEGFLPKNTSITANIFASFAKCPQLTVCVLDGFDFSQMPSVCVISSIEEVTNLKHVTFLGSKLHPKLLDAIINIKSLESLWVNGLIFKKDDTSIGYERVLYLLRQDNAVPAYYTVLERPYFEEFYVRSWTSSEGKHLHRAGFVDLKEDNVLLKTTYDGEPFSVSFAELSKRCQNHVHGIVHGEITDDNAGSELISLESEGVSPESLAVLHATNNGSVLVPVLVTLSVLALLGCGVFFTVRRLRQH